MAAVRSAVNLTFGPVSTTVAVHSAIQARQGNVQVCAGTDTAEHDPVRVQQRNHCPHCGVLDASQIRKAREVPEGLVLLSTEDLATVNAGAEDHKRRMVLTPHPAGPVDKSTLTGDKAYHLIPQPGHQAVYGAIARLVAAHPELAFMTRFTPRTNVGVFRVDSDGTNLFARERVQGDRIRAVPDYPQPSESEVDELVPLAEMLLSSANVVRDFDLDTYRDTTEDAIAAIVAQRTVVPDVRASAPAAVPAGVEAARKALEEALAAGKPAPKTRARRSRKA